MSKKSLKIEALLQEFEARGGRFDPYYAGYFECFNRQMYYEAHDVLEELWLKTRGPLHLYYKGLIQLAGAFVHLQKSKLNPAARLFRLALKNLRPYAPVTEGLDVARTVRWAEDCLRILEKSDYARNPHNPAKPPRLSCDG